MNKYPSKKITRPGVLVAPPKRRYPVPMAVFPASVPGSSAVLDAIKQMFFADCPEKFEVRFYRSPRVGEIPYEPIPAYAVTQQEPVVIPHRRLHGRWIPSPERSTP